MSTVTSTSETKMGRPKRVRPAKTIRIDADLISRSEMLAKDQGEMTIGEYVSALLRPAVEREWRSFVQRNSAETNEGPGAAVKAPARPPLPGQLPLPGHGKRPKGGAK